MRYDFRTVGGFMVPKQIEDLPVNGRGFLEVAKLHFGFTSAKFPTPRSISRKHPPSTSAAACNMG